MPSQLHELHLLLFRSQPTLAADLMRGALGATLPLYSEARVASADLTEVQPQEYRADMVIELWMHKPVYGIVVEVQLSADERKRFVWPAYVANLRARLKCPVSLLVVTADDAVARWAAQPIHIGGLNHFTPYVLGPSSVPEVTDEAQAHESPELAVLSAMAHGHDANFGRAVEIALAAKKGADALDAYRSRIYVDLILSSLGEAARKALKQMDPRTYEFQSDFARECIAIGKSEGRAELVIRLLTRRFGAVGEQARARIERASIGDLDAIGERLLTAATLQEALDGASAQQPA